MPVRWTSVSLSTYRHDKNPMLVPLLKNIYVSFGCDLISATVHGGACHKIRVYNLRPGKTANLNPTQIRTNEMDLLHHAPSANDDLDTLVCACVAVGDQCQFAP